MNAVVRPFAESDAAAAEAVYSHCRAAAQWLPAAARSRSDFARGTKGELLFVAEEDGEVIGFVSVWVPGSFIHHLYVREDARERGVGRALLAALAGRIPYPWRLKCLRANVAAEGFYRSQGWKEVGSGDGEDGPYAVLELNPGSPAPGAPSSARA